LKYHNLRALAEPLAVLLRDYLEADPRPVDVLVPVPLHQRRLRARGYNQSGLLSHELGKLTGLPVIGDCLLRVRAGVAQARAVTAADRQRNVSGAFVCRDNRLAGRQVLLIDDVATTGATLAACAGALKAAGATTVWALVLSREI
jgi:ComF family protein